MIGLEFCALPPSSLALPTDSLGKVFVSPPRCGAFSMMFLTKFGGLSTKRGAFSTTFGFARGEVAGKKPEGSAGFGNQKCGGNGESRGMF